jgi:hypothetical protein
MRPSRPRAVLLVMVAALWAAPRASRAQDDFLATERRSLLERRDPDEAERFLAGDFADHDARAWMEKSFPELLRPASDPKTLRKKVDADLADDRDETSRAYLELFRAAVELKDLRELLTVGPQDKDVVRQGLTLRPDCAFCQDAKALEEWSDRYGAAPRGFLRAALYDWDTLDAAQKRWLAAHGRTPASWGAVRFGERQKAMSEWAKPLFEAIMKAVPRTPAELKELQDERAEIRSVLDNEQQNLAGERVEQDAAAVKALAEAESRLAGSNDPRLRAALEQARSAPDLDARLTALAAIFDGLHVPNAELRAAAPLPVDRAFDAKTRRLAAEMLGPALLQAVDGTWAGAELKDFYARNPMKITIRKDDVGAWASYNDETGAINFSSPKIEEFLKARGRGAADLTRDGALLRALAQEMASTFVHEATHQRQGVWAKEQGIPDSESQYGEMEAMETEALFVLEKSRRDPSFKRDLERAARDSDSVREDLERANQLWNAGPADFRKTIRIGNYPELLSLEGETWKALAPDAKGADAPAVYAKHRARFDSANAAIAGHLRELEALKPLPAPPDAVPAPARGASR